MHPGHLVTRWLATFTFFRTALTAAAPRLQAYLDRRGGAIVDEPATAEALATVVLRGLDCGAFDRRRCRGAGPRRLPARTARSQGPKDVMTESLPDFTWLPDLALRTLGGAVVWANDESFAEKENLISPGPSTYRPASFGHKGQVYDGWETRRRRETGLRRRDRPARRARRDPRRRGRHRVVQGQLSTRVSVDAIEVDGYPHRRAAGRRSEHWTTAGRAQHGATATAATFEVNSENRWTHVRLNIYPDGGVARLRVHGEGRAGPAFLRGRAAGPGRAGERRAGAGLLEPVLQLPAEPDLPRVSRR